MELLSLSEFSVLLSVSEPTVRKRLPEAPEGVVVSQGKNGEKYQIDAHAGVAWWRQLAEEAEAERIERRRHLEKLQLELLGDDAAINDNDLEGLSPAEKAAQLEAELKAIKLGRERGELVRALEVEAAMSAFIQRLGQSMNGLTDRLRKRAEISDDAARVLDRLIEQDLMKLADMAEEIGKRDAEEIPAASRAVPASG